MKNKKIIKMIICILCIILLVILGIIININKEKKVTCTLLDNKIKMKFKNNRLYYVSGTKKFEGFSLEGTNNLNINYDEKENTVKFSLYYSQKNEYELLMVGFNYNNSDKYKDVLKMFESENYLCK